MIMIQSFYRLDSRRSADSLVKAIVKITGVVRLALTLRQRNLASFGVTKALICSGLHFV